MATTITRATWTDGVGGTVINNAVKNSDIYDPIDDIIANNVTFGGTISAEGVGDHTFSGGATGGNTIILRNTTAGTGNFSSLELGNDSDADLGRLECYSSTFTETGAIKQDGIALRSVGDGGLSLAAEHASGTVRLYAGGTSKIATFNGEEVEITGSTRGDQHLVGVLDDSVTTTKVGNAADLNWTTLYSYTFPANTFDENNRITRTSLMIDLTSDQKDFEIYFGGTGGDNVVQLLNNSTSSGGVHKLDIQIARVGSNSQRVTVNHNNGVGAMSGLTATTQTDSGTIELLVRVKSDSPATANVGQLYFGYTEIVR